MKISYLLPRLIRHFLPQPVTRFLLRHGWFIRPGKETSDPQSALQRYRQVLEARNLTWERKRVLVFGYGGYFAVGCGLLASGADHVILCDKYAPVDDARNRLLLPQYEKYLYLEDGHVHARKDGFTLLEADIRELAAGGELSPVDLVFSSDVFEHLDDVDGVTRSLAALTHPKGMQIHFIDLRDHFFKYPFEMLCYSQSVWRNLLNPGSNHNRYRYKDYRRVFELYFEKVDVEVVARDEAAFEKAYHRIRPEFLTGDDEKDAITLIQAIVSSPRRLL